MEALSRAYDLEASKLFAGLPHDAYLIQTGVCRGYESALGLIARLDAHTSETNEHRPKPDTPRPSPFFGGPWHELAGTRKPTR